MRVLAFETSCDETAVAVVQDGTRILANVVASQIDIHRRYGGIVPEVASRQHVLSIVPCYEEAMASAGRVSNRACATGLSPAVPVISARFSCRNC